MCRNYKTICKSSNFSWILFAWLVSFTLLLMQLSHVVVFLTVVLSEKLLLCVCAEMNWLVGIPLTYTVRWAVCSVVPCVRLGLPLLEVWGWVGTWKLIHELKKKKEAGREGRKGEEWEWTANEGVEVWLSL